MAPAMLSPRAVENILEHGDKSPVTVQVIDIKKITVTTSQSERYRISISDGEYFMQAMSTNKTKLFTALQKFNIIKLTQINLQTIQDRRILLILGFEIVSTDIDHIIGDPKDFLKQAKNGTQPVPGRTATSSHGPNSNNPTNNYMNTTKTESSTGPTANSYHSTNHMNTTTKPSSYNAPVQKMRDENYLPISALSLYQNRWQIKARISNKGDIKHWSNPRGEGTLFSVELIDENGDEIRGTFFKEQCDKFYNYLQQGKVYAFSGGRLKVANKQYSSIKCDYEITFDSSTKIEELVDDNAIKSCTFEFIKIGDLQQVAPGGLVDIIGIVKECYEVQTITTKRDNKELKKRDLLIADDSNTEIRLTLWGAKADSGNVDQFDHNPVYAFKGVKVSDYGGRTLGCVQNSQLFECPDVEETLTLQSWWQTEGQNSRQSSFNNGQSNGGSSTSNWNIETRNDLKQITDENLGYSEKGDYLNVKGRIKFIKSDGAPYYPACTIGDCKKKVTQAYGGDSWHCEKCGMDMPAPNYRYILSAHIVDHTSETCFASFFNDQAEIILGGKTANELQALKSQEDPMAEAEYEDIFNEALFKEYYFQLRCKYELVTDQQRLKVTVRDVKEVDYENECAELTKAIALYEKDGVQ